MDGQLSAWLPRQSLLWIFAVQLAVLLPHFVHLPPWLIGAWILAVYWRLEMFRGRRKIPGKWLKLCVVVAALVGLLLSYRQWLMLESMVALLAVSFTLKNIELLSKRDALLSLLLAYFLVAALFAFAQNLLVAAYGVGCIFLITAALIAQQSPATAQPRRAFTLSLKLLAQAVPIMLLLLILVPRLGPLWAAGENTAKASTGISDSMSPGDFTELSKSPEPVLRIAFDGPLPPPQQRYWRGLVYTQFDGRRWSAADHSADKISWPNPAVRKPLADVGPHFRYRVIQEPSYSPWLFALVRPESETLGVAETADDRLINGQPVNNRFAYWVRSWPRAMLGDNTELAPGERKRNLQLPVNGNPQARVWAEQRVQEGKSATEISRQLLRRFNHNFIYTLQPPPLGRDSVDEFLFATRQGFCEHFASSYVFIMRAAGVPARVVAGYQGGEWMAREKYLLVRQYDAHAWAEIWTQQHGWQRVDPTAAVSPERIFDGLESAAADEFMQGALFPIHRWPMLNTVLLQWEMVNYRWYNSIMGFDRGQQQQVLQQWLGEVSWARWLGLLAVPIVFVFTLLLLWLKLNNRSKSVSRANHLYLKFCRRLARAGIKRAAGEPPRDFARRVAAVLPRLGPAAAEITTAYEQAAYNEDIAAEKQLRRLLRGYYPMGLAAG